MSYEKNYYKYNNYSNNVVHNNNNNNQNSENNQNIEMTHLNNWHLQPLYTETKHVYAAKTDEEVLTCDKLFAQQNVKYTHPSSIPVIVKDVTRPYTYYTMKSYGQAQDNNYYVNFDDVSGTSTTPEREYSNAFENNYEKKLSFDDDGCVKTYLCSILACFACCLFQLKPT